MDRWFFSSSKKKKCPVCLEYKQIYLICSICSDTNICQDCSLNLCEKGLCDKCPVCRQTNWKKAKKIKRTKILPSLFISIGTKKENIVSEIVIDDVGKKMDNSKLDCKKILHNLKLTLFHIAVFLLICGLIYCLGMFTLFFFGADSEFVKNGNIFWLSPIVGLMWVGICCSPCCFGKTVKKILYD